MAAQRLAALRALKSWISLPLDLVSFHHVLEGIPTTPFPYFRVFSEMVNTLCAITCAPMAGTLFSATTTPPMSKTERILVLESASAVAGIMRTVMDACATIHLIPRDPRTRRLSRGSWSGMHIVSPLKQSPGAPILQPLSEDQAAEEPESEQKAPESEMVNQDETTKAVDKAVELAKVRAGALF